jgi:hypothetical protein
VRREFVTDNADQRPSDPEDMEDGGWRIWRIWRMEDGGYPRSGIRSRYVVVEHVVVEHISPPHFIKSKTRHI